MQHASPNTHHRTPSLPITTINIINGLKVNRVQTHRPPLTVRGAPEAQVEPVLAPKNGPWSLPAGTWYLKKIACKPMKKQGTGHTSFLMRLSSSVASVDAVNNKLLTCHQHTVAIRNKPSVARFHDLRCFYKEREFLF